MLGHLHRSLFVSCFSGCVGDSVFVESYLAVVLKTDAIGSVILRWIGALKRSNDKFTVRKIIPKCIQLKYLLTPTHHSPTVKYQLSIGY